MIRSVTTFGLIVVGACAVAVSFAGLYGLALLCRFDWRLAALVPVLVDAGAGVAAVAWLAGDVPPVARRYARRLALGLLGASVAGNATAHLLATLSIAPPWWVVVLVGALAPAVLAAVIHLSALVRAGGERVEEVGVKSPAPMVMLHDEVAALGIDWPQPPAIDDEVVETVATGLELAPAPDIDGTDNEGDVLARARELAAAGVGRPTLVKELGLKEHVARAIVEKHKPRQETAV